MGAREQKFGEGDAPQHKPFMGPSISRFTTWVV